jgi:hypothetical protein
VLLPREITTFALPVGSLVAADIFKDVYATGADTAPTLTSASNSKLGRLVAIDEGRAHVEWKLQ